MHDANPPKGGRRFTVAQLDEIPPQPCPCGLTRRAFTEDADGIASMHLVDISEDAKTHYHKRLAEIYFIREGKGALELDGERVPVRPGTAVLIKPGCRHRAVGKLKVMVVAIPAFDPEDEWMDEAASE